MSGFIVYDKVLYTDKTDDVNKSNEIIENPQDFINKISKTEEELKNKSEYTVNYQDFSYTAHKNENNIIGNIVIKYKDKTINKDLSNETKIDAGLHILNTYYFDESTGLFILTLLTAPVAAEPKTYIIAFDSNGNIKQDEMVRYNIYVDEKTKTLIYNYRMDGGLDCYEFVSQAERIHSSVIIYEYIKNEIIEISRLERKMKDLPKCE